MVNLVDIFVEALVVHDAMQPVMPGILNHSTEENTPGEIIPESAQGGLNCVYISWCNTVKL